MAFFDIYFFRRHTKKERIMSEDVIQEIQQRMKELEALKADLWEKGEYDPMMAEEFWD